MHGRPSEHYRRDVRLVSCTLVYICSPSASERNSEGMRLVRAPSLHQLTPHEFAFFAFLLLPIQDLTRNRTVRYSPLSSSPSQ
jgi:hypothetical protein